MSQIHRDTMYAMLRAAAQDLGETLEKNDSCLHTPFVAWGILDALEPCGHLDPPNRVDSDSDEIHKRKLVAWKDGYAIGANLVQSLKEEETKEDAPDEDDDLQEALDEEDPEAIWNGLSKDQQQTLSLACLYGGGDGCFRNLVELPSVLGLWRKAKFEGYTRGHAFEPSDLGFSVFRAGRTLEK